MRTFLIVVAAAVAAAPGAADAQSFSYRAADDVKDAERVEWTAAAEAGIVLTTGNSETTTLTGGGKASRRAGKNKLEIAASGAYARIATRVAVDRDGNGTIGRGEIRSDEKTTAETIEGRLRYDRYLSERQALYAAAIARRDVPAGKQVAGGGQLGYSRTVSKTAKSELVAEAGYDFTAEKLVGAPDVIAIHSLRGFLGYKGQVGPDNGFEASLEALTNLNPLDTPTGRVGIGRDGRVNARIAWTSKIGKDLALAFSLDLKFDAAPAPLVLPGVTYDPGFVPEASNLDSLLKGSLIYSFF
jgi:hypothetical protein